MDGIKAAYWIARQEGELCIWILERHDWICNPAREQSRSEVGGILEIFDGIAHMLGEKGPTGRARTR